MTEADLHRAQLAEAIRWLADNRDEWEEGERADSLAETFDAFRDMQERGRYPLSEKQIAWIRDVAERCEIDLPEPPRAPVPRGREVPLMFKPGPLMPPGRS